jgi:hypothetical protein
MAFLNRFETVVVGHGYFTRMLMNRLWRACHKIDPAIAAVYEWRAIAEGVVPRLPIIPPGRQGPDFLTPQFDGYFADFVNALKEHKVFLTSPCAVAYLNKTTCYTRVGEHEDPELRKLLCQTQRGKGCPNEACEFHHA